MPHFAASSRAQACRPCSVPSTSVGICFSSRIGRGEQFGRPARAADIEPGGAGRIRHFRNVLAGQPEPQIVLRQQHLCDLGEDVRLVVLHPGELRRGEAGKDDVAGELAEARVGVERGRLGVAARVVPQDAGAQHLVVGVEQRRAMHVAGKADALDRGELAPDAAPSARRSPLRSRGSSRPGPAPTSRDADATRRASALAEPTIVWPASISSALTPDVPRSRPRYMQSSQPLHRPLRFRLVPAPHFRREIYSAICAENARSTRFFRARKNLAECIQAIRLVNSPQIRRAAAKTVPTSGLAGRASRVLPASARASADRRRAAPPRSASGR